MILGILTPDGGSMRWKGRPIDGTVRRHFGYLPEERGLYGKMKVREHVRYFGRLHGLAEKEAAARTRQWIARLELETYAERPCSELSKGNQQKVQIACAAVHSPELLVLDEPFSGLDPVNAEMLLAVLKELKAQGATLVLSSHQMWQLEELCGAFCIISGGENRIAGTLEDLRAHWPTRVIRTAPATAAVRDVLDAIPGARRLDAPREAFAYEVPMTTPFSDVLRHLVAVEAIRSFEAVEPSLHEIYLHAVEG
jgi:ABC-2 type transport system ATP-binding protein